MRQLSERAEIMRRQPVRSDHLAVADDGIHDVLSQQRIAGKLVAVVHGAEHQAIGDAGGCGPAINGSLCQPDRPTPSGHRAVECGRTSSTKPRCDASRQQGAITIALQRSGVGRVQQLFCLRLREPVADANAGAFDPLDACDPLRQQRVQEAVVHRLRCQFLYRR